MQTPVGRSGIVIFLCSDPTDIMSIQNFLHLIIVGNIAKPTVQLDKQDQINFILLHILQHPHKLYPVAVLFPGGNALIGVDVH